MSIIARTVTVLPGVVRLLGSAVFLVSFGSGSRLISQEAYPSGIYTEIFGLNASADEIDAHLPRAFSCPEESFKKIIRDRNEQDSDGKKIEIPGCHVEQKIFDTLLRVFRGGGDVRRHLEAARAVCQLQEDTQSCRLQRDVVRRSHAGSHVAQLRDIFTIDVLMKQSGEPVRVTLMREGVGR